MGAKVDGEAAGGAEVLIAPKMRHGAPARLRKRTLGGVKARKARAAQAKVGAEAEGARQARRSSRH